MDLATLLPLLAPRAVSGPTSRPVLGVGHDSRTIGANDIFVAIQGGSVDGRRFAPTLSCAAVIADGPVEVMPGVTTILVDDARKTLALAAAALHGHPARALSAVGITGTNGKTTTALLLEATMSHAGEKGLVIGTTGHRLAGRPINATHTTPEAPVLHALMAEARDASCSYAVMEVSSIGLDLRRVDAIPFNAAAFTSFSQDHLDFHGDMTRYLAAKARLFDELLAPDGIAVLFGDDPAISSLQVSHRPVIRYGRSDRCDVRITDAVADLDGCRATVLAFGTTLRVDTPLVGAHNLENAVCAFVLAQVLGLTASQAAAGLAAAPHVPGRLQPVPRSSGQPRIFVDYAHTPDALVKVLTALRPLTVGAIHTVFGCGGDRDRAKRPHMGRAVAEHSDRLTVTSDNPRSEDPLAIIAEVVAGISAEAHSEVDRRTAIFDSVQSAGPNDVVLIAGKGHETTQTIGTQVLPFDDRLVAAEALGHSVQGPDDPSSPPTTLRDLR